MDIGDGGGNAAPTADFTHSCTNLDCSFTDQSSDSDGSIASWSWDFGDGATSSQQHPSHTYSCDGIYTVTLTVTDDDGATGSTSTDVSVSDVDTDGDGLSDCEEKQGGKDVCGNPWAPTEPTEADTDGDTLTDGEEVDFIEYCTKPNDPDSDDDEFSDRDEVNPSGTASYFGFTDSESQAVFCGSGGSPCAYPVPRVPDLYLEVDGWEDCGRFGEDCHDHAMSAQTRDGIISAYADHGVTLHVDTGQYGDGGQFIPDGEFTESMEELKAKYALQEPWFDRDRRLGIFHHMIYVHQLTKNEGDLIVACGISSGNFSAVAHGNRGSITAPNCSDPASPSESIQITSIHELAHGDMRTIEPDDDWCSDEPQGSVAREWHDDKTDWAMAASHCGEQVIIDHHDRRWREYTKFVDDDECTNSEATDNDPKTCPSLGDLNNGLRRPPL